MKNYSITSRSVKEEIVITVVVVAIAVPLTVLVVLRALGSACMKHKAVLGEPSRPPAPRVDWVADYIGMTTLPGRKKGRIYRNVEDDMRLLREEHGADVVVSLVEPHELVLVGAEAAAQVCEAQYGMRYVSHPVRDKWVPSDRDAYKRLVADLCAEVEARRKVVIHCNGGKGRTGTLVVAMLCELTGCSVREAIRRTQEARPGTIRNPLQQCYLYFYL